jgi:LmbE family N-acetylglucosaminyl deacetylase
MNRILIVTAHLDDETFGLGGSILKWREQGYSVKVLSVCKGRRNHNLFINRQKAFMDICKENSLDYVIGDNFDLELTEDDFGPVSELIRSHVEIFRPHIVYSTSETDLHKEHRLVGNATKLACRPSSSTVQELYQFYIPGASDYSFEDNNYNVFLDITKYTEQKKEMILKYETEIKEDENSIGNPNAIMELNRSFGIVSNCGYAEKARLIYKRN